MTPGPRSTSDPRGRADSNEDRGDAIEAIVHLGTWVWSRASGTIRPSRGLYRLLRLDPEAPPLSPDLIASLIHEDDRAALDERRQEMLTGRGLTVQDVTYRLELEHGMVRRYAEHAEVQSVDATGLALTVLGIVQDVTGDAGAAGGGLAPSPSAVAEMMMHVAAGMGVTDATSRWLRVNRALCDFLGYSEEELLQRSERQLTHPDDSAGDALQFHRLFSGDVASYAVEQRYLHRDGHVVVGSVTKTLIKDSTGTTRQAVIQIRDLTEHVRALDGSRFLNEAAQLLALSLESGSTLHTIAHLAVPQLADWCVIDLVHPTLGLCTVESAAATGETAAILRALRERYPPLPFEVDDPLRRVLATGRASFMADISHDTRRSVPRDPEHLELIRRLGHTASMIVPLAARGRITGAITLGPGESKRRFDRDDLRTAELFATLAALAIDNARLYDVARDPGVHGDDAAISAVPSVIDHAAIAPVLPTGLSDLSDRERKVFALSARGHTAAQIAEKLFLSPKTVETYRARAMRKVGIETRSELVALAIRAGLLESI